MLDDIKALKLGKECCPQSYTLKTKIHKDKHKETAPKPTNMIALNPGARMTIQMGPGQI